MSSSLRASTLEATLASAVRLSEKYGITRVTDTTRLDIIGIPVFASIRPDADEHSLCVHAGKGVRSEEARVGAYMEAIEFAAAEFRRSPLPVQLSTPRSVAEQPGFKSQFVDLCPLLGLAFDPDDPISCAEVEDVATGTRLLVPAELVFFPYNENPARQIFGTGTNGLCSGNSVDEATIHGLCELVERDVQAFNFVHDQSFFVSPPYPKVIETLFRNVTDAGLICVLRFTANEHGLPYFQSFILEPRDELPIAISHGTGCHPMRDIAAVRAVTEAAQSRLSYIHGGRDDLIERAKYFASQEAEVESRETARMRSRVSCRSRQIAYDQTPDFSKVFAQGQASIGEILGWLVERMDRHGFPHVLRTTLNPDDELPVVRVIVPGLESFEPSLKRAGPRLRDYVCCWK